MSFQPVIPTGGLAGWRFLQRTYEKQFETFSKSAQLQRDTDYFLGKIGEVQNAEDLVKDRRLLSVALGAFGLSDDINNRFFIQKILQDGTKDDEALANRLSDKRYKKLSEAFGFGPGSLSTTSDPTKMADVVALHRVQSFEESVGQQDDALRIALFAQRELLELANNDSSENAKWYSIMGLAPLRKMFETALGLPQAFGQIDIDQQLDVLKEKTRAQTGSDSVAQFLDPEALERMTNLYLARSQIAEFNATTSSGATALALLQAANS